MKHTITILMACITIGIISCENAKNSNEHSGVHAEENHESHTRHAAEESYMDEVYLSADHVKEMGVIVENLKSGIVDSKIQRPATVRFNPDKTVQVGPRISAKVEKVRVDLGQRVLEGQALAHLSSVELGEIKAGYLSALSRYQTARKAYEREKKLYEEKISSESNFLEAKMQFENASAALASSREKLKLFAIPEEDVRDKEQPLSYFVLESPIGGVVQKRDLSPGQTLSPKSAPIHIVNNSEMWVMIDAYEQDIARVQKGQHVILMVKSLPGRSFEGKINWISEALDEKTRTLKIRAVVNNPSGVLKDGMYGTAGILSERSAKKPIIPVDAVQIIHNETVVFVPSDEAGSYKPVAISTGKENNGWIEITGNIQAGDPVVTRGAFHLKSTLTSKTRSAAHHH